MFAAAVRASAPAGCSDRKGNALWARARVYTASKFTRISVDAYFIAVVSWGCCELSEVFPRCSCGKSFGGDLGNALAVVGVYFGRLFRIFTRMKNWNPGVDVSSMLCSLFYALVLSIRSCALSNKHSALEFISAKRKSRGIKMSHRVP